MAARSLSHRWIPLQARAVGGRRPWWLRHGYGRRRREGSYQDGGGEGRQVHRPGTYIIIITPDSASFSRGFNMRVQWNF
jgi:hypothetical protein